MFAAVFALSSVLGPLIGGLITDTASWRWVFYVNVPIGLATLTALALVLPHTHRPGARARDLDYFGVLTCAAAVVPLLIGLTQKGRADETGNLYGWLTPHVGGLIGVGLLMLVVFLLVESRAREPILPLDLFRSRTYSLVMASMFLVGFAMYAATLYLPRFYQVVERVSATRSGLEIWPLIIGFTGGSLAAGRLISRSGRYKRVLAGSLALLVAGAFLMTHLHAGVDGRVLWSWMLLFGFGIGPSLAGYAVIVQAAVPPDRFGVAAGTLTFFRRMGGGVGLAVAGSVFNASFANQVPQTLPASGVPSGVAGRLLGGSASNQLTSPVGLPEALAADLPAPLRPLIPDIVTALH
jgi:MFS family permease